MLPIEAGCNAIIIGGNYTGNLGKEVVVVRLHPIESGLMGHNVWIVSPVNGPLKVRTNNENKDYKESNVAFSLERNLMRIDGKSFPATNLQDDMDDLPNQVNIKSPIAPIFLRFYNDNNNLS